MSIFTAGILAYLAGGFPTGVLVSHWILGRDIRDFGSGNPGAVNIWRIFGIKWGIMVVIIDVGKGWGAAHYIPQLIGADYNLGMSALMGVLAVVGHIWSPFTHFRGGKGVGTAWGVSLALYPINAIICFGIWLILVVIFRYASVASLTTVVCWHIIIWLFNNPDKLVLNLSLVLMVLLFYSHRANLQRLIHGNELKVGRLNS